MNICIKLMHNFIHRSAIASKPSSTLSKATEFSSNMACVINGRCHYHHQSRLTQPWCILTSAQLTDISHAALDLSTFMPRPPMGTIQDAVGFQVTITILTIQITTNAQIFIIDITSLDDLTVISAEGVHVWPQKDCYNCWLATTKGCQSSMIFPGPWQLFQTICARVCEANGPPCASD